MKVIIAGSRSITDPFHVWEALQQCPFSTQIKEVVCGNAAGVDTNAANLATEYGWVVRHFPAKWTKYGRSAGFVRNQQMGWYADGLIAVWDGQSSGTRHMIQFMERLKKPVYVHIVGEQPPVASGERKAA